MARSRATQWLLTTAHDDSRAAPGARVTLTGWTDAVEDQRRPVLGGSTSTGAAGPVVQWVAGGARRVAWRARWAAADTSEDLEPTLRALDTLRARDSVLLRAPLVYVVHPQMAGCYGLVETADYSVVSWWPNGQVREVVADLAVVEVRRVELEVELPGAGETLWTVLADGETFESLAARLWRDPLRGDLIRRTNPDVVEEPAARVRVLEREHPKIASPVRPVAPAFARLADGSWPSRSLLEQLGVERLAGVGVAWERLPEVVAGEV